MTPAEQAALLAYQQEQQRSAAQNQQDQGGLLDALGKLALGAGAVAAGAYGVKRLLRGQPVAPSKVPPDASAVRRAASAVPADIARQQQGIELTRAARAERPRGVVQTDLSRLAGQTTELPASYYQRTPSTFKEFSDDPARALLTDPQLLKYVESEEAAVVMKEPAMRAEQARQQAQVRRALSAQADEVRTALRREVNTSTSAAQSDFASDYLIKQGYQSEPTLVDTQQSNVIGQIDHYANAVNAAEDQESGRMWQQLRRNEHVDLAAVDAAEDQVDAQLARQTATNPAAASTFNVDEAINQVAANLEDGLPVDQAEKLIGPVSSQEMVEMAKQEMISRRAALEEAGLRPGTVRFERALAQPFRTSANVQVRGTGEVSTSLPAGPLRQTVQGVSAAEPLIETTVPNIGPEAVVTRTAMGTAIRGASPSYHEALPKERTRLLYGTAEPLVPGAPEEMAPDIRGRLRGGIQPQATPEQLSKQEIVYGTVDRPAPEEIPGGSAGIGVYGLEPGYVPGAMSKLTGEYSAAAERIPSQPTFKERKTGFEGLTSQQLITGAEQAKSPALRSAFEKESAKRETTKASLEVSEALRRARIEGRDPQAILRQFGIGR